MDEKNNLNLYISFLERIVGGLLAKIAASRLRDRMVVAEQGHELGLLFDIVVDEKNGKIIALMIEPTTETMTDTLLTDKEGLALIPFPSVRAVKDFIVVDARRVPRKIKKVGIFARQQEEEGEPYEEDIERI
jgi:sporulation protein YlmC with PRC-barrel domain